MAREMGSILRELIKTVFPSFFPFERKKKDQGDKLITTSTAIQSEKKKSRASKTKKQKRHLFLHDERSR